jgi:hypothetical protein
VWVNASAYPPVIGCGSVASESLAPSPQAIAKLLSV